MNLDELIENILNISNENAVKGLGLFIAGFKNDDRNINEWTNSVEKYFGNIWIENEEDHNKIYKMWSDFKNNVIKNINGMTMNERLYLFGLMEKYDLCKNEKKREIIYKKLNAEI